MTNKKLDDLRRYLVEKQMNGFLVPRADAWPGEFVSPRAERLKWLSGFSGSAGIGIVLQNQAAVLTDGRYTLQVAQELDPAFWTSADSMTTSVSDWLLQHDVENSNIGFDPTLHSLAEIEKWQKALTEKNITLVPHSPNPVDILWIDQPDLPDAPVIIFPASLAGLTSQNKIGDICASLTSKKVDHYLFTMPDSIAWLLNVRGGDVRHTPVPLSFGVLNVFDGSFAWFIDPKKVSKEVQAHCGLAVKIYPPDEMEGYLTSINGAVGLDQHHSSFYFSKVISNAITVEDPCILRKACKNEGEQKFIRQTHIEDAHALMAFQEWLYKNRTTKKLDEISIEKKLQDMRAENKAFQSPSFDTICGFEGNGAVIHYRATAQTNKAVKGQGLLLVDSGAQYLCDAYAGTTDVTRTYLIGEEATPEQRFHYTMVLKAHIAVSRARFPYGTTGVQIDAIGRSILWQEGLDFAHGLGHGVGCFLNVHEEAASLSPRGKDKLEVGMLLSNEPGYYREGEYGIRIENLMLVQKTGEVDALGRDILCFETVTLAPYENDLIDFQHLGGADMRWLEDYYRKIAAALNIA